MKNFSVDYQDHDQLKAFINTHIPAQHSDLLVQIFAGVIDPDYLANLIHQINVLLPSAKIVGATTAGEVKEGVLFDGIVALNFSVFQTTTVKTHYLPQADFATSHQFAKTHLQAETKAVICFTECFSCDPVDLFKAIYLVDPDIVIAGGAAGDNGVFEQTYIMQGEAVYDTGVVLCTLQSNNLRVSTEMALNWIPIGREMTVTKSVGNVVYEINEQPVLDVYRYYLGDNITLDRPYEFPLIKVENGVDIGRSCVGINPDESFIYAGHLNVGDQVRFSVGNVDESEQHAKQLQIHVNQCASEAIYTYSCFGRKTFLGTEINHEFTNLQQLAPTNGFFSFGEFYSTGKSNQVLSNTTTVLSLCEDENKQPVALQGISELQPSQNRMRSLTCLVNVTQRELHESIELLRYAQNQLIETEKMASLGALVAGVSHEINTPVGVALTGNSQITHELNGLKKLYETNTLSEDALKRFISTCSQSSRAVNNSLENAVKLVNSFKSISVDQHSGEIRNFNFKQYTDEIIISFKAELRTKNVNVINNIPADIELENSPGIFAQIFSNLIMNSLHHAFDEDRDGNQIVVYLESKSPFIFHFLDNGRGVAKENLNKVFDPFFTTARGQGGSGLGLNVVYNLVTQSLNGKLNVIDDREQGFHIAITLN